MINANQITSRLRMMSDQELQRFAEMHKQDPYMFPLAFNESNMRKEMRSAPQGQGAAPQAPVNQQALAAMQPAQLPEDQGIGALNPNMQFADGGLVAFAGGGEAGPYARADDRDFGTGGVAYADGGAIRFAKGKEVRRVEDMYGPQLSEFYPPNPADLYGPDIDQMLRAGLVPPPASRSALLDYIEGAPPSAKKRGDRSMDSILAAPVPVPAERQAAPLTSGTYGTGVGAKYADRYQASLDAIEERKRLQQPTPVSPMLPNSVQSAAAPSAEDVSKKAWQNEMLRLKAEQQKTSFSGRDTSGIDAKIAELEKSRPESMKAKESPPEPPMPRRVLRSPFDTRASFDLPPVPTGTGSPLEQQKALVNARVSDAKAGVPPVPNSPLPPNFRMPGADGGAAMPPLPTLPGGPRAAQPSAGLSAIPRAPAGAAPGAPDDSFVKNIRKVYADAEEAQAKRDAQREMEYLANRPESESFKERKAALEEDRADVEKESRMNEGLAWLTFASKVVQPGKNTIQALVEGASAGGEQYSRAQKELKKAEKERKMGLASLAEAERAAKAGDFEKAQARRDAMATRSENSMKAQVDAVAAAYGITQKAAYDMLLAQMQITSQENTARERNETAIYGHQLDAFGRSQTQAATAQRDIDKQAVDIWTDPAKKMALPGNIKTLDDLKFYLRGINGVGGDQNAAAGFTVRR